ncbi:MAG: delta-60 repeat domain-containing protein [Kineosporiaceae bacterium]
MTQRRRRRPIARILLTVGSVLAGSLAAGAAGTGLAAPANAAGAVMLSSPKSLGGWGVVGYDGATSPVATFKSNVTAITEWNNRIYIGGMFTAVARNGVTQAKQPYLAAFDRATGTWVSTFRPRLDGGVWDLAVTPAGKLLVGGYFANANGSLHRGLVALNPSTGAVDPGFAVTLSVGTGRAGVRSLDVNGPWVYVGGNVTTVTGGTGTDVATVRGKNLFRLKVTNGRPDGAFKPIMSTAPWQVYASRAGDRVYAAGRFGTVNGAPKEILAVLSAADGRLVPGVADVTPTYDCRPKCSKSTYAPYSQAVLETTDRTSVIGTPTEHAVQIFSRATLTRRYGHYTGAGPGVTRGAGGDYQALAEVNGIVYGACHCFQYDYDGAYSVLTPGLAPTRWDRLSRVNGIAAYDAVTLKKIDTFSPQAYGSLGDGAWQLFVDSRGCLWAGGDFTHASGSRWLGGFTKFCTT